MVKHETPEEFDWEIERLDVSVEEYYEHFGLSREEFWELYFELGEIGDPIFLLRELSEEIE